MNFHHGDTEVHGETKCLRESSCLRCLRGERRRGRLVTPFLLLLLTGAGCGSRKTEEPAKTAEPVPPPPIAKPSYDGINVTNGGAISGVVRFTGTKPKLQPRPVTKNSEICGHGAKPAVDFLLGPDGGVQNVVVIIEGIKSGKKMTPSTPVLDQIKCDYVPHVQSVTLGSTLEIRNSDDLLHNVHGKLDGRITIFNLAMPLKGQSIPKQLTKPGVIHLQCDAGHTWMSGYIVVVEHPYHTTTGNRGTFALADVPPGSYRVKAWHERFGTLEQEVSVAPGSESRISFDYQTP